MKQLSVFVFDDAPFAQRLSETIAWCRPRARRDNPQRSLRSDALRPWLLASDRGWTVFSVIRNRALYLFRNPPERALPADLAQLEVGRLLVYFPDVNLCCGAAEQESDGFFDVENTPPWDTWVALGVDHNVTKSSPYRVYLVSWVPPELIELADAGIRANPEGCLRWLEDVDVGARHELYLASALGDPTLALPGSQQLALDD
ncbi:MAG: hypothetical protein AB7R00_28930 [Kofleriaceae bacterium]